VLIDDRTPPPSPDERPIWEPNWAMWLWIAAALGTFVTASATDGLASVVLLFACVGCAAHAATRALPDTSDGLRDYRQ
jgi:hypothetical protein